MRKKQCVKMSESQRLTKASRGSDGRHLAGYMAAATATSSVTGGRASMTSSSLGGHPEVTSCGLDQPPPLMSIDQPNPPNVVISNSLNMPQNQQPQQLPSSSYQSSAAGSQQALMSDLAPLSTGSKQATATTCTGNGTRVYNESNRFLLDTHQIIAASRTDPDLLLAGCSAKDTLEDVDLDNMYMEAMLEDCRSTVTR